MANLVIPRQEIWTSQPQGAAIDWTNPITRGLISAFVPGSPLNLANGRQLTLNNVSNAVTRDGVAYSFPNSATNRVQAVSSVSQGDLSLFCITTPKNAAGGVFFGGFNVNSPPNTDIGHFLSIESGQGLKICAVSTAGSDWVFAAGPVVSANKRYALAGTFTGGGGRKLYVDGALAATNATSRNPQGISHIVTNAYVGGNGGTGNYSSPCESTAPIHLAWGRILSDQEISSLALNPWQIFAPRETYVFPSLSAGGDATGSGSLSPVSVSNPTGSASGSASATVAFAAITIAAPTATASAGGSATASGSLASLTIAAPTASASASGVGSGAWSALSVSPATGTASASATASCSLAAISVTSPTGTASAGLSATASGSLASVNVTPASANATASASTSSGFAAISVSPATATATGTTAGNAVATATPAQITISPATASAIASAVASGVFASLSITAPTGTATSAGDAQAIAAFAALSINPATGAAYGSALATGSLPVISVSPATGTASTGSFTGSISDADITRIVQAVLAALNATTIPVDMQKTNGVEIVGDGTSGDKFRSVLYVG